eukprot:g28402.t1
MGVGFEMVRDWEVQLFIANRFAEHLRSVLFLSSPALNSNQVSYAALGFVPQPLRRLLGLPAPPHVAGPRYALGLLPHVLLRGTSPHCSGAHRARAVAGLAADSVPGHEGSLPALVLRAEYEVLLLQFPGGIVVTQEEAQNGHVVQGVEGGVEGGVEVVRNWEVLSSTTPGTFPCNRRKCCTCLYTCHLISIPGTEKTFHIKQMFTCTSANVVYCIRCSRCGFVYIGETKRQLGDRFVKHLRLVRDKRQHLPVANHFTSASHSLDNMCILDLLQCHKDATQKLEEQHLISCLGSLQPNGLNVDFT